MLPDWPPATEEPEGEVRKDPAFVSAFRHFDSQASPNRSGASGHRRVPNLHAPVLHPEVGSFSHVHEQARVHHA